MELRSLCGDFELYPKGDENLLKVLTRGVMFPWCRDPSGCFVENRLMEAELLGGLQCFRREMLVMAVKMGQKRTDVRTNLEM